MEECGWSSPPVLREKQEPTLLEIRARIDELDKALATLLAQRLSLAREAGKIKAAQGIPIQDSGRESEVVENVKATIDDSTIADAVEHIYQALLDQSRKLQDQQPLNRQSPRYFPKVAVIGMGLIGGALARQIKRKLPDTIIIGCDSAEILEQARIDGVINHGKKDAVESIQGVSLILLAAHPEANLNILRQIAPHLKSRQVVMDLSSTKKEICLLADQLELQADFVGGHPFFGSEKSGYQNSKQVQIEGRSFSVSPSRQCSEITTRRLIRWLSDLDLNVMQVEPEIHDACVAKTSHLIQLLAVAAGCLLADDDKLDRSSLRGLSGRSLESLARLMNSPPQLWLQILRQNNESVREALANVVKILSALETSLAQDDLQALEAAFKKAATVAEKML